jgi:predicted GIY-YIG superfamily endonuclease
MYHVYILASRRHGTLYIGVTNSLQERLEQHRNGKGYSFVKADGVSGSLTSNLMIALRRQSLARTAETVEAWLED